MIATTSKSVPNHLSKREIAEISIRNAIETGLYKPGQVVSQRQISEDLGLSVTPIREAILVLTSNGIVERHKHQSIKVSEVNSEKLRQLFSVRHMIEEEAVRLAATNADDTLVGELQRLNDMLSKCSEETDPEEINSLDRRFHGLVFGASGNEALVWTIDRVKSSFPMYALWREPGRVATSAHEHQQIIDALRERDGEKAASAQRMHLSKGLDATIVYLERKLKATASLAE
ncbi:GntR family transcriptional regulator [Roseibium sp. MMSF_3544]|uniref:GntR family transcriptional regulator n=1 Tax=unclassified Roseibium TaxID=2629323 RepID=UPI00273D87C3|nr:GntR family transcriptional regulator [Roseibium sp. MMSF_3544]